MHLQTLFTSIKQLVVQFCCFKWAEQSAYPSRTRYLLDILKTKSYLPETYLIDNYLVTYCHLLKISFLNI